MENSRYRLAVKRFLNNIHNAPHLKYLILKYAFIKLADIKTPHDNAPQLVELKLDYPDISITENETHSITTVNNNHTLPALHLLKWVSM